MNESPTVGYCSGCRVERRLRFGGFATDGRENGTRPRAFYRACQTCGSRMLVLGDLTDAMSLVRNVVLDWRRATGVDAHDSGNPALRTIDLDDLTGDLTETLWRLYDVWNPAGLSFRSYASGLLPRRLASYVRDAVGSDALYRRNGRGGLCKVWPKAHAASVCDSLDGAATAESEDTGDGRSDRLARVIGAVAPDFAGDRSPDLGRALVERAR